MLMQQMGYSASRHPHGLLEVLRFRLMVQRGLGRTSHKHQWEKRSMKHYAGLDVSVKETSLCILDETGKVCRELKVTSHPDDLVQVLRDPAWRLERVGLEAGPPLAGHPDAFQKPISILNLPCAGIIEGRRALVHAWA